MGLKPRAQTTGAYSRYEYEISNKRVSFAPATKKQMRAVTISHRSWGFTSRNGQNCCAIMGSNTHEHQNVFGPKSDDIQNGPLTPAKTMSAQQ